MLRIKLPLLALGLVLFLLLAIAGCQTALSGLIIVPDFDPIPAATGTPVTRVHPVVVSTVPPPPPTLQLANQVVAAAAPATTPDWPTMTPSAEAAVSTATTTATPSPTPPPTFTPPALPNTPPWEHYWFWRPIPEGGTVWTDKAYPYGSTRGGTLRPHHGVEFNVPSGTPILAAASGTVVVAGDDSVAAYGETTNFYGNVVVIEHESTFNGQAVYTLYGHLSIIDVSVGQYVNARDLIAHSGASGIADGPHLHFEVRLGANSYLATHNPLLWLYPFTGRGTVAGRIMWPDGALVAEAAVRVRRIDAPSRYAATTTYAISDVNADAGWQENFAVDDIVAGYYEVIVAVGDKSVKSVTWVYPRRTSFVEIVLDPALAAAPEADEQE